VKTFLHGTGDGGYSDPSWVRDSRTDSQQKRGKHGPDQDIVAPRCVAEPFEIPLD
jgi:hypothetical protein